ncbi:hypothetical protein QFC21_000093 [Naganishia friedmannii]|uniref:Uncharacterized protein n=1 Tax=Naganishia friedmannii TaxID=89922 RepID=A0ACC2WAJ5_9TREE|nr:hypothetical protein QFC21_000093 [Naganishia friedmannii]
MISLLKPSSGSQSAGLPSPATNKDGHRLSIGARMGIGVNQPPPPPPPPTATEVYSPPLTAGPDVADPTSPTLQLNGDDYAQQSGILIHTDTPSVSHRRTRSQDLDGETNLSSPMPPQTAMLPISPALSASAQLINNASEKIPADQLPSTVNRPGVPARAPSKIRFAPLPNPRRQRSMSTGRNIAVKATLEPDGTRTLQRHAKRDNEDEGFYQDQGSGTSSRYLDEQAVDDEEDDDDGEDGDGDEDEDDDEGGGDGRGKRSSWKTMGMGHWKPGSFSSGSYTKKLLGPLLNPATTGTAGANQGGDAELERLTSRDSSRRISADIAMPGGQSLRKTFSTTSGFIGSSPFRTAGEHERKRTFFPGSSTSGASGQTSASGAALGLLGIGGDKKGKQAQRASNTPDFSSLSASMGRQADTEFAPEGRDVATSPRPVKMLNGRVYGKNRQSQQASISQSMEPEFVEWGGMMGSKGGGLGSVASATAIPSSSTTGSMGSVGRASGNNEEEDDGSGISWLKKRREARERERRASELTPTDEMTSPGLYAGSLPTSSEMHKNWGQRGNHPPVDAAAHLPSVSEDRVATPIDTAHFAFNNSPAHPRQEISGSSSNMAEQPPWINENSSPLGRMQAQDERHANDDPGHIVQAVQIPASPTRPVQWRQSFATESEDRGLPGLGGALRPLQSPDDEYEEEEGVDGDFESDDEEELAAEEIKKRSTSSAAGVEVVSRHRD